jgi:hypothetical protein
MCCKTTRAARGAWRGSAMKVLTVAPSRALKSM